MVLQNILSQEIVQKLGWTLLHFVWQAAAVALLLGILLAILRKFSANVRYIIACVAMGLIVLLPIITIQMIHVSTQQLTVENEPPPKPFITVVQPATEETSPAVAVQHEELAQLENTVAEPSIPWKQRVIERLEPALPYLVAGWLLGVFGLSLWHLGGWTQLQRLRKKLVKQVDTSINEKLLWLSERLRVKQTVQLLESALVQVPTVVGWLRPVILLPASALTGLTAEQLEALLAHELAHIRRYDYLINMLQTVIETLGFYHPAVWWISHRIRSERENCCDDVAVSISGDRVRYARALTSMEEIRAGRSELAVTATGGNLFTRIRRIVGKDSNDSSRASWIPSAITILLIAIISVPTTIALTTKSKSQEPEQKTEQITDVPIKNDEGRIEGRIVDIDTGGGISGAQIEAVPNSSLESNERFTCKTAEDGTFTITDLQSGEYLLQGDFPSVDVGVISGRSTNDVLIGIRRGQILLPQKETTGEQPSNGQIIIGSRLIQMPADAMKEVFGPNENFSSGLLFRQGHEIAGRLLTIAQGKDTKLLIAPQMSLNNNGYGTISIIKEEFFTRYYEPNENEPGKLDPQVQPLDVGWKFKIFAGILRNGEQVHIKLAARRQKSDFETLQYRPGYDYQIPSPPAIFATDFIAKNGEPVVIGRLIRDETAYCLIITPSVILPERQPEPLLGKKLPEPDNIQNIDNFKQAEGKRILVCFWDMNQRPSRNLVGGLAKRKKELADKNVAVLLVDTSGVEPAKLKEWLDNRDIPFTCGSIKDNAKDVLLHWGVQAQPWLILTDQNGIVRAEGFSLEQLDEKLQEKDSDLSLEDEKVIQNPKGQTDVVYWGLVRDEKGDPIEGAKVCWFSKQSGGLSLNLSEQWNHPDVLTTDKRGEFMLRNVYGNNIGIYVKAEGYAQCMIGPLVLPRIIGPLFHPGDSKKLMQIVLQPGADIFGKIVDDGQNVVGARISAHIFSEQLHKMLNSPWPCLTTKTDENGFYRLADLPAGPLSIGVNSSTAKGNLNIAQKTINIERGDKVELNFGDEEGFALSGVVTVDGEAVEIASVMIQLPNESVKWGWTDRNGNFRITGIPSGRYELYTTYDKNLDPVTFFWGKDGEQVYDIRHDRHQITIENDLSIEISIGEQSSSDISLSKSTAPSAEDKSIVRVDLSVVEVPPGSEVDRETTKEIRNLLGGKITIQDSPAAADLLRKAAGATAPVKDESTGDKRVTQKEFNTLFDLLVSRGYVKILMNPTLEVAEHQTAELKSEQNSLEVTANAVEDDILYLTVQAELTSQIAPANEGKKPIISKRSFANVFCVRPEQSAIFNASHRERRAETTSDTESSQLPAKELLCIVTASLIAPPGGSKQQDQTTVDKEYEVIQLSHINANEAAERVNKAMSQLQEREFLPSVLVQPLENTGQIIVFGRKDLREIVKKLIAQLDTPSGLFETRTFQLKYADPDLIKERIEGFYKNPANEPQEAVKVIAYPKTKQVTVIASPENLSRIAKQIAEWDTFQVFKPRIIELQNSNPVQMAGLLTKLFAEEDGDEVNIRDVIMGEDIAGPLSSHFIFESVPETSRIIVMSNIPRAYDAVEQLILELDKQKMATKDIKQVREWIAGLIKEGRLGVQKTTDESQQPPASKPVTRVYDISDLIFWGERISRGAVDVMMDRSDALGASPVSIPDQAFVNEAQKIVNLITQTIDSNSWFQNNPNATGIITPYPVERPRKLAIYQTLHAHQQIQKLLALRREQIPTTQISIELRYLYTNAEFLDEVRNSMGIEFTSGTVLDDKQLGTLLRASQKKKDIKSLTAPMPTAFNNETVTFSIAGHIFMSFLGYSESNNISQQSPPAQIRITPHIEDSKNIIIDFLQDIPGLHERIIHDRRGMRESYTEATSITNKRIPNNKTFAFVCDLIKSDPYRKRALSAEKKTLIVLIKPTISVQEERPPREAPSKMLIMPRIDPNNPKFKELEEQVSRDNEEKKEKNQTKNQTNAIDFKPGKKNVLASDKGQIMFDIKILTASDEFMKYIGFDPNTVSNSKGWLDYLVDSTNDSTSFIVDQLHADLLLRNVAARMQTNKDIKMLHTPQVLALSGKKVEIHILESHYYMITSPNEPNVLSLESESKSKRKDLNRIDLGTIIRLIPTLTPDGKDIELDFEWEYRRLRGIKEHADPDGKTQKVPQIDIDRIMTSCTIPDGKTLLIAGKKITVQKKKSGKPQLADLPLIGMLFSNPPQPEQIRNLIIMVTPTTDIKAPSTPQSLQSLHSLVDPNDPLIKKLEEKFKRHDETKKDKLQTKNRPNAQVVENKNRNS